jgi:nitrogen fixation protein FixH
MKINWGWGITAAIILFMGFIVSMVVRAFGTDADLTSDDYYAQEIAYETRISAKRNTAALEGEFTVQKTQDGLEVRMPSDWKNKHVKGEVHLYRPDNAAQDQHVPFEGEVGGIVLPIETLLQGHYIVRVSAEEGGNAYYFEQAWTCHP